MGFLDNLLFGGAMYDNTIDPQVLEQLKRQLLMSGGLGLLGGQKGLEDIGAIFQGIQGNYQGGIKDIENQNRNRQQDLMAMENQEALMADRIADNERQELIRQAQVEEDLRKQQEAEAKRQALEALISRIKPEDQDLARTRVAAGTLPDEVDDMIFPEEFKPEIRFEKVRVGNGVETRPYYFDENNLRVYLDESTRSFLADRPHKPTAARDARPKFSVFDPESPSLSQLSSTHREIAASINSQLDPALTPPRDLVGPDGKIDPKKVSARIASERDRVLRERKTQVNTEKKLEYIERFLGTYANEPNLAMYINEFLEGHEAGDPEALDKAIAAIHKWLAEERLIK